MDGWQRLVINPNERAISTDHLRLQAFKGRDAAEIWRAILDTNMHTDDLDASSDGSNLGGGTTTQNTPVNGQILNGLTVIPQIASLSLIVQPGEAFLYDPDATPNQDESQFKLCNDPGIQTTGVLQMTANSSGSTRIDVIECARANIGGSGPDSVIETDNRDIYNTTTGLFSATTVNKVSAGRLQYRVRVGTPGGGFPGLAQGWMPLAVAAVPTGTTTNDTIVFWDVRPLAADRIFQPFALARDYPRPWVQCVIDDITNPGHAMLTGIAETSAIDFSTSPQTASRYRLGGRLRRGSIGSDNASSLGIDGVDLADTANQDGTLSASTPVGYVYLLEPFGLPRWARYTDPSTGDRRPRDPRGIVVLSAVAPKPGWGGPSSPISLANVGFASGSTQKGSCILVCGIGGTGPFAPVGAISDGKVQYSGSGTVTSPPSPLFGAIAGVLAGVNCTFTLVDGTTHPANAKAVWVQLSVNCSIGANTTQSFFFALQLQNAAGAMGILLAPSLGGTYTNASGSPVFFSCDQMIRVPLPSAYPSGTAPTRKLVATQSGSIAITSGSLTVMGWEI